MSSSDPRYPPPLDATYLVADICGWSHITHALGPDPTRAAILVDAFWTEAQPLAEAEQGEVYSWQGDALLVAFRGEPSDRMDRALHTAARIQAAVRAKLVARCWDMLGQAEAEARFAGSGRPANTAITFSVSTAITDGLVVAVPRDSWHSHCKELTGDSANLAFAMAKHLPPDHIGVTSDVYDTLETARSSRLSSFAWGPEEEVTLAGGRRQIRRAHAAVPPNAAPLPDNPAAQNSESSPPCTDPDPDSRAYAG